MAFLGLGQYEDFGQDISKKIRERTFNPQIIQQATTPVLDIFNQGLKESQPARVSSNQVAAPVLNNQVDNDPFTYKDYGQGFAEQREVDTAMAGVDEGSKRLALHKAKQSPVLSRYGRDNPNFVSNRIINDMHAGKITKDEAMRFNQAAMPYFVNDPNAYNDFEGVYSKVSQHETAPQAAPQAAPTKKESAPAKQKEKKGLSEAQIKSRIKASAYNNDDPNKWGLKGAMPNGWGVVKLSNGKVVVTPPSESNFYGDAEKDAQYWEGLRNKEAELRALNTVGNPYASHSLRADANDYLAINGNNSMRSTSADTALANLGLRQQQMMTTDLDNRLKEIQDFSNTFGNELIDGKVVNNPQRSRWAMQALQHLAPNLINELQANYGNRAAQAQIVNKAMAYLTLADVVSRTLGNFDPMNPQRLRWNKPGWKFWGDADRYYVVNAAGDEIEIPLNELNREQRELLYLLSDRPKV